MDEAGVDVAVIMTFVDAPTGGGDPLQLIADACAQYPGRLVGFARLHPAYGEQALELLNTAVGRLGFRGLKLHPVGTLIHPAAPSSIALVREAARLGVPVLFHCGDEALSTPYQIAALAEACPEATIILGHMGGYYHVDDAIQAAAELPNLVLETSAMPYPAKIGEAVRRLGAGRVVFGSDGPMCSPRLEIEKVRLAGLTAAEQDQVLGQNMAELLGLSR
jgi:predicted TIM-barrel fold metal-dependent hydrolase